MKPAVFGSHEENTLKQLDDIASRAVAAALMGDGHFGYIMPVGGVAAYDNQVSVVGVGFDIACGNAAIRTDLTLDSLAHLSPDEVRRNPSRIIQNRILNDLANELEHGLSFGIGRKNNSDDAPVNHLLFNDPAWGHVPNNGQDGWLRDELRDKARRQLGTLGSGNHYADVFYDEAGAIWVGVHFGSRGLGHTVASAFLALNQGKRWGDRVPEQECLLSLDSELGYAYWDLMNLCGQYAYAGREWVARKMVEMLGGTELELVHNHHNFAWKETHSIDGDPREVVVVRKGATPAFPGQKGFVGGSMGDNSVVLQGAGAALPLCDEWVDLQELQASALFSTVHGAGRVMSRTAAAGKRDRKTGRLKIDPVTREPIKPGLVSPQMMEEWLSRKGVILRGGGLDESPHCYRRLPAVLEAQQGTVEVLHTLTPVIVCMAGANEFDPFKD